MATLTPEQFASRMDLLVRTGKMGEALTRVATRAAVTMRAGALMRTTGGNPLHVRSGKLRQSIKKDTTSKPPFYSATIQAGGRRAFYASVHEYGKVIRAKSPGGYLRFKIGNKFITTRSVTIPKRPFLAPSLEDARKNLDADLMREAVAAFRTVGIGA
jgi:phage gpG-like protein